MLCFALLGWWFVRLLYAGWAGYLPVVRGSKFEVHATAESEERVLVRRICEGEVLALRVREGRVRARALGNFDAERTRVGVMLCEDVWRGSACLLALRMEGLS